MNPVDRKVWHEVVNSIVAFCLNIVLAFLVGLGVGSLYPTISGWLVWAIVLACVIIIVIFTGATMPKLMNRYVWRDDE